MARNTKVGSEVAGTGTAAEDPLVTSLPTLLAAWLGRSLALPPGAATDATPE